MEAKHLAELMEPYLESYKAIAAGGKAGVCGLSLSGYLIWGSGKFGDKVSALDYYGVNWGMMLERLWSHSLHVACQLKWLTK